MTERLNLWLCVICGIIFALGLLMIFSTTSAEILDHAINKNTHHAFLKQIYYAIAGCFLAFCIWKMGYQNLLNMSPLLLSIFSILLVMVLIPGIGKEVNGSKRWLNFLGLSFQPSEFVKYLIPAYFIQQFLPLQSETLKIKNFLIILGKIAIPMLLILIEPNNGTCAVIGVTLLAVFLLMQVPFKFWALPLGIFLVLGTVFASQLPYVKGRINVYLHPELDLKGRGHQPYQAKIAAGSGQFWGKGPGNSLQKLSYLPEAQNDYIAAIFAEECGFIGILILITLYMSFSLLGFLIAFHAPNKQGFYLASAITFLISLQAFLNMGVVSGLLPSTGLNLPLFSQGGTSLMANITGIGLLLSVSKPLNKLLPIAN